MNKDVVRVEPVALVQSEDGCMMFLGDGHKHMLMHIDPSVGHAINLSLANKEVARPMTHDLFTTTMLAFGAKVTRCTIVDVDDHEVYYARIFIEAKNEVMDRKIVEVDARPSDAIALAVRTNAPIYFLRELWNSREDRSGILESFKDGESDE